MPYNLSVVKKKLNDALANNEFSGSEAVYLKDIISEITKIEQAVKACFHNSMNPTFPLETLLNQFAQNTKSAHETALKLTQSLLEEIKSIYIVANKLGNHKLSVLLISCSPHFEAVLETCKPSLIRTQMLTSEKIKLYEACKALGGYFLPMEQMLDPLAGRLEGKTRAERFRENGGKCEGFVREGYDELLKTGIPEYFPVTEGNTEFYMTDQNSLQVQWSALRHMQAMDLSVTKMGALPTYINKAVQKLQPQEVYKLGFLGNSSGHATRVRIIPGTNIIEFYEPNHGTFFFYDKAAFASFFVLVINHYKETGMHYDKFFFFPIGKNVKPNKNPVPLVPDKIDQKIADEHFIKYISDTLSNLSVLHQLLTDYQITQNDLRVCCHDTVVTLLSLINEATSLKKLQTLFEASSDNLAFMFEATEPSYELTAIRAAIAKKYSALTSILPATKNLSMNESASRKPSSNESHFAISNVIASEEIVYFNNKGYSINDFRKEFFSLMQNAISEIKPLEAHSNYSRYQAKLHNVLTDLEFSVANINQHFNLEIAENYLTTFENEMINIHMLYQKDNQSNWTKDNRFVPEKFIETFKGLEIASKQLRAKYGDFSVTHSSLLSKLSNEERIIFDKEKLAQIIIAMKKFSSGLSTINQASKLFLNNGIFPRVSIINKLEAIMQENYHTYQELETEVHRLNHKEFTFAAIGKFPGLLDEFFIDHLGYKDYSRKNSGFSCSTLSDVDFKYDNTSLTPHQAP